jgi:hypothetical protein
MKLAKLTGCIMLITEQNEGLCLSTNSLPLYTQVYCYFHLWIVWQTAPLASSWLLITSPVINPSGTDFILLLQKVYTNINWQTVFIIVIGAWTLCSYCSVWIMLVMTLSVSIDAWAGTVIFSWNLKNVYRMWKMLGSSELTRCWHVYRKSAGKVPGFIAFIETIRNINIAIALVVHTLLNSCIYYFYNTLSH